MTKNSLVQRTIKYIDNHILQFKTQKLPATKGLHHMSINTTVVMVQEKEINTRGKKRMNPTPFPSLVL